MEPIDRTDEHYWKLGFIYFNPDDPKVVLPKRIGLGWTFNFARLWSWVILVGIITVAAAIRHYAMHAAK